MYVRDSLLTQPVEETYAWRESGSDLFTERNETPPIERVKVLSDVLFT